MKFKNRWFVTYIYATIVMSLTSLPAYNATLTGSTIPINRIDGPGLAVDSALFDSSSNTGINVSKGQYIIRQTSKDQIIGIAVYVTSDVKCIASIKCDDVMAREIAIQPGSDWYYLRIPFSSARRIVINWSGSDIKWNEVRLLGRTPIQASASLESKLIPITLGKDTSASADVMGFMCNWFEHGITDGMTKSGTREEFIRRFKECHANSLRFPGGTMTYGYPGTHLPFQLSKRQLKIPFSMDLQTVTGSTILHSVGPVQRTTSSSARAQD